MAYEVCVGDGSDEDCDFGMPMRIHSLVCWRGRLILVLRQPQSKSDPSLWRPGCVPARQLMA